jgi:hypothetical protein
MNIITEVSSIKIKTFIVKKEQQVKPMQILILYDQEWRTLFLQSWFAVNQASYNLHCHNRKLYSTVQVGKWEEQIINKTLILMVKSLAKGLASVCNNIHVSNHYTILTR